jgi:hypothetical protein
MPKQACMFQVKQEKGVLVPLEKQGICREASLFWHPAGEDLLRKYFKYTL